jgi:predicted nuclease of predicted toxin-antitoxin system
MTKLLVDENIPPAIVAFLRNKGFDVKEVHEFAASGASDASVMELARRQKRTLVTFDKHFANILLYPLKSHYGVIRIRIHPPLLADILRALDDLLERFDITTFVRTLIVLERDGFRVRRAS